MFISSAEEKITRIMEQQIKAKGNTLKVLSCFFEAYNVGKKYFWKHKEFLTVYRTFIVNKLA